ncbi:MAG: gamma-glutamyl-gamma-aminobutyrate hydrolase family protein [Tannerella sp.]|jgi:microsomal dipeptidase-like Zn-dependent dipeptidase/gamma-glutamyl-gamma-aminobutyrate hydrolase PuuD|nr:gamma-glutamyl-gamma-aminobutyrate hydrolase family protein [Tannerella sp.]
MENPVPLSGLKLLYKDADDYVPCNALNQPPKIGISSNRKEGLSCIAEPYFQSVALAGGAPVLIPVTTDIPALTAIVESLDGLILSGGGDIDPHFFGEEPVPELEGVDSYRDTSDLLLLRLALNRQLPVMGICRGHQLINVALGGTLYQDIHTGFSANALQHSQPESRDCATHTVTFTGAPSKLRTIFEGKDTIHVNSFHHQAVKDLAPELIATAVSPDGLNEALEHPEYPLFSVQWHPEEMAANGNNEMLNIFRLHVRQARTFAQAKQLHNQIITIDSHTDTPMVFPGSFDLGKKEGGKVNLPFMEEGRLDAAIMVAYLPQKERDAISSQEATDYALERLSRIIEQESLNPHRVGIARTPDDLTRLKREGKKAIFLGVENGYAIGKDLSNLQRFKDLGVSYITLCHNGDNDICDSASKSHAEWGGLSPFGKEVVSEMNRLGIMVDISHAAESSFYDALEQSRYPIIASHSSVRALADHPRNLYDEQIKALAAQGGVMQICIYKGFLNAEEEKASLSDVIRHIRYVVDLVGIDYAGIGSDFDGDGEVIGCRSANELIQITMRLIDAGFDNESIRKIWGGNLLRVMRSVQSATIKLV